MQAEGTCVVICWLRESHGTRGSRVNSLLTTQTVILAGDLDILPSFTLRAVEPSVAPRFRQLSIHQTGRRAPHPALVHWEHPPPSPPGPVSCVPTELYGPRPAPCEPLSMGRMEHSRGKHATWFTVDTQRSQRWARWRMKRHMVGWPFLSPSHTEKCFEDSSPWRFLEDSASGTSVMRQGA